MLSRTIVKGRLVKEPILKKKTTDDRTIKWAYYRLAVNNSQGRADYLNCVVFGWEADFIATYGKQGTAVIVSGRLKDNPYTDREGNRIHAVQLIVDVQGLCANWKGQEIKLERMFSHKQDFPALTIQDMEELMEEMEKECVPMFRT